MQRDQSDTVQHMHLDRIYMQIIQLKSGYLTTNVGFIILKNECEMSNVVGLKEAVDLCLAEDRGAGQTPRQRDF